VKDAILKLRGEGKTYMQIRAEVGCAVSTISYYCGEGQKEKTKLRNEKRKKNKFQSVKNLFSKYKSDEKLIAICQQYLQKNGFCVQKNS
jgi:hypothetical protein